MGVNAYRGGVASTYATGYPDPFRDLATGHMPYSVTAMLRYAEYFALSNETFREALARTGAYFLTELEITGDADEEEKTDYTSYMVERAGYYEFMIDAVAANLYYGAASVSVLQPFTRWLLCPGVNGKSCSHRYRLEEFAPNPEHRFTWRNAFYGHCPACGYTGDFGKPWDPPDRDKPLIYKVWNPYDIVIDEYDDYTGEPIKFRWQIPSEYRQDIRQSSRDRFGVLARAPWPVLQAVIKNQDLSFRDDFIHYWRVATLPGVRTRGYGIPRGLLNFRCLYYLQMLRWFNESLAAAHIVPFRIVSPMANSRDGEASDPIKHVVLANMHGKFMSMLARHTQDPGSWHFSPVSFNYQALGADARQLAPKELIDQGQDTVLNGSGVPTDFYRMNLQMNVAPVGLRLFERIHTPLVRGMNRVTQFVTRKTVEFNKWEEVDGKLARNDLVDLIESQQLIVQMAMSGQLAQSEGMKVVGKNFAEQQRKKVDEQRMQAEIQMEAQKEQQAMGIVQQVAQGTDPTTAALQARQQQSQGGGQQGGGQQGGPQGGQQGGGQPGGQPGQTTPRDDVMSLVPPANQPIDPVDMQQRAQAAADRLLDPMVSQTERTSILNQVRQMHTTFHGALRMEMDRKRNQARSSGQSMALQQMYAR